MILKYAKSMNCFGIYEAFSLSFFPFLLYKIDHNLDRLLINYKTPYNKIMKGTNFLSDHHPYHEMDLNEGI